MKQNVIYGRVTEPTAFVTKGRQRVKQYNQNVFLKNGDEFELELYNPKSNKILVKIKLNGNYISSSGIVLRPGERVFLERYFDEARKFMFETYEVDANNPDTREAIKKNGEVEVEFYDEYNPLPYLSTITYTYNPSWTYYTRGYVHTTLTAGGQNIGCKGLMGSSGSTGISGQSNSAGISSDPNSVHCYSSQLANPDFQAPPAQPIETGIVDKGDFSNQIFDADYSSFNCYYSSKVVWKILPESQKAIVKEDLKVFCTNCGAKRKKSSHKFCPHCGTKF